METFQVEQMISDVARARVDLAELSLDDSIASDRLAKCRAAANDLENAVCQIIGTPWIPRDSAQLFAAIQSVHKNIERVRSDIAAALDVVLLECKPDELYRVWCAMSFADLLKVQLDVLMTALAHSMCSCACRGFVPEEWAN